MIHCYLLVIDLKNNGFLPRISLYRHNSCIIKLYSPFGHHSTAQAVLKGNVITFMQNIPNIVSSLPLGVDDLCDTIKIIFIGAHKPDRQQLRKICGVKKQKVRDALLWLKKHNYLYRKILSKTQHCNFKASPFDTFSQSSQYG
jgi:hypothetical protein